MKRTIAQCPACDSALTTTELQCGECGTTVRGVFSAALCAFCSLPEEQLKFLELFLRCRGNLRDVERTLGLSYPTVRARLDVLLSELGYTAAASETSEPTGRRREILDDLNAGRLTTQEAIQLLEALE